jgi:DNA-binding response OmpR family regulator
VNEQREQPPRVLVVDDELTFSTAIADTLQSLGEGFVVDTADNGSLAWDKIQKIVYELVITDLRMPQVDGLELVEKIRSSGINTPLILMTAYGSASVEAKAKQLNVARYLPKPIDIDELIEATRDVLNSSSDTKEPLEDNLQERMESVSTKLETLRQEISAHCIILANAEGQPITYAGYVEEFDVPISTALIAAGHSTFFELARSMSEDCVFNLMYNEGTRWNTFSTSVCKDLFMVIVFERQRAQTPIGMVWFSAKRTIAELLDFLTDLQFSENQSEIMEQLRNSITAEVDQMLSADDQNSASVEVADETNQELISFEEAMQNGIVSADLHEEEEPKSKKKAA